jgi:hypothetical protein
VPPAPDGDTEPRGDGSRRIVDKHGAGRGGLSANCCQLAFGLLSRAGMRERLCGQDARAPFDEPKAARRGFPPDRREDRRSLCSGAPREQDPSLRLVQERSPGIRWMRPSRIHDRLPVVEQARRDKRLDGDGQRVAVGREPVGVLCDLAREVDRFVEPASSKPQPDLRSRVVDNVLELGTLR